MRLVLALLAAAVAALVVAALGGGPAAAQDAARATASAQVLTGAAGAGAPAARAQGTQERSDRGRVDATGVTIGSAQADADADATAARARASAVARSVTLLGGRVTAFGVRRTVTATDGRRTTTGRVDGLRVDGRLYDTLTGARRIPVGQDGIIEVNRGATGLRLTLLAATGGLPAGTDLRIATVSAGARAAAAPTPTPTPTATPAPTRTATPEPTATASPTATPRPKRRKAPSVQTRLTRSGFAFPIYPPESARVADNYGGVRPAPIVTHEGVDIFAKFGSPVVAVADGTLSKVGTLPISGNRLWLTTAGGDAFFYAHLSSFSEEAVSGREVKAGTVLGFTGNTGDAEPTPPHVHFEVHPGGIEAPSVDPYPIVMAWQGRDDVPAGAFLRREGADTTTRPGSLVAVRDFIAE